MFFPGNSVMYNTFYLIYWVDIKILIFSKKFCITYYNIFMLFKKSMVYIFCCCHFLNMQNSGIFNKIKEIICHMLIFGTWQKQFISKTIDFSINKFTITIVVILWKLFLKREIILKYFYTILVMLNMKNSSF